MSSSRFIWRRGWAVVLGLLSVLLLTDAFMVLVDVLPKRPSSGASDIAHWRSDLVITFSIVFVPGVAALLGALALWRRSQREEPTNAA